MIVDTSKCESLEEVEKYYDWDRISDPKFPGAKVYQGTFEQYLDSWMKASKAQNKRLTKENNELKILYDSSYAIMRAYLINELNYKLQNKEKFFDSSALFKEDIELKRIEMENKFIKNR